MVQGGETSPPPPPDAPRPPSAPPLPESTTVLRLEVPASGFAVITMRGFPIISKYYGSDDLRLHVPLRFNAAATMGTADDVGMSIVGPQPAILFEDEGAQQVHRAGPDRARTWGEKTARLTSAWWPSNVLIAAPPLAAS